ncbi:MAG: hypothetical protein HKO98_17400, partial [Gemmatimonadetes bacterium]|nr:hypothetical protein [Gemmatimonadota bacterium]
MTARSPHLLALLLTLGLAALPAGLTAQTVSIERGQLRSGSLETGDTARFTFEAGED